MWFNIQKYIKNVTRGAKIGSKKAAYKLLQAQAGDGYITNVRIKESWTYALVGTVYKMTLTATVYPRE